MAAEAEREISGLELLRQPATFALIQHLNDVRSTLEFQAFLYRTIVNADYGHGVPSEPPKPGERTSAESAVAQMEIHSTVLGQLVFCHAVNNFLTYLAHLMTLIYEKYPKKLPLNKQTTYRFCIEHHMAGDLLAALADVTVMELTHQNLDSLAEYFTKKLDLVLFTKDTHSVNARLCVDIRNIMTHNRGIVNRFFIQRYPQFAGDLGRKLVLAEHEREEMLGDLGYCARQLDLRAVKKYRLETIEPKSKE